jgi:hypothetical protein
LQLGGKSGAAVMLLDHISGAEIGRLMSSDWKRAEIGVFETSV